MSTKAEELGTSPKTVSPSFAGGRLENVPRKFLVLRIISILTISTVFHHFLDPHSLRPLPLLHNPTQHPRYLVLVKDVLLKNLVLTTKEDSFFLLGSHLLKSLSREGLLP